MSSRGQRLTQTPTVDSSTPPSAPKTEAAAHSDRPYRPVLAVTLQHPHPPKIVWGTCWKREEFNRSESALKPPLTNLARGISLFRETLILLKTSPDFVWRFPIQMRNAEKSREAMAGARPSRRRSQPHSAHRPARPVCVILLNCRGGNCRVRQGELKMCPAGPRRPPYVFYGGVRSGAPQHAVNLCGAFQVL